SASYRPLPTERWQTGLPAESLPASISGAGGLAHAPLRVARTHATHWPGNSQHLDLCCLFQSLAQLLPELLVFAFLQIRDQLRLHFLKARRAGWGVRVQPEEGVGRAQLDQIADLSGLHRARRCYHGE